MHRATFVSAALLVLAAAGAARAQLTNTDFETGFVAGSGHAYVPTPWDSTSQGNILVSFDTWDDSGANGLLPNFNNVFTGITANSGHRWTGGWNFEDMHQLMGFTLTPGQQYQVEAFVHAPNPGAGLTPGGFAFGLGALPTSTPTVVATFPVAATFSGGWLYQSATFTAPANAASLPYFFPICYSGNPVSNTYMGIDDIHLRVVPTPGAAALLGLGGTLCLRRRR